MTNEVRIGNNKRVVVLVIIAAVVAFGTVFTPILWSQCITYSTTVQCTNCPDGAMNCFEDYNYTYGVYGVIDTTWCNREGVCDETYGCSYEDSITTSTDCNGARYATEYVLCCVPN